MPNSAECEVRVDQKINKSPDFVMSVLTCERCELFDIGLAERGAGLKTIASNNKTVERFKKATCPKVTGILI
ncbi:MAG: hypothetical protein A3B38_02935 [Candidatus Levybacteria bacterium RIFCSPLOWO2_01_FULL_36_13]|nr:MAG: hypothetical protein A2684_04025 [Candidatus Levybacteria bacterium RIFCSPHIGHO2_01_FULL_36_15b]OGH35847.1 MAG: hypothetical protein A3B38_02935 [Candidatus Levybacteria bacterium RIFCSPLOWO2_01_FULL_36_13]